MATAQNTEARELALIDKVELRVALADSDSKLENVLRTYLPPLLLKLASEHVSVRNKVIAICQHISTRTKPRNIQLPIAALLKQFQGHPRVTLIRHFDLIYITQGIHRLPVSEQADLLTHVAHGISSASESSPLHGATLFNILLRCLLVFKFPLLGSLEDRELRSNLDVSDEDARFLSFWLGKLFYIRLIPAGSTESSCMGLTVDEYSFLTVHNKPDTWDPTTGSGLSLTETKFAALRALSSGIFRADDRFLPALYASSDQNLKMAEAGEDLLKRTLPDISLESDIVVEELFAVYHGASASDVSHPPTVTPSARIPLRIKVLNILSKSITSTKYTNKIIELVRQDLTTGDAQNVGREGMKLRSAIVSYLTWVARRASPEHLGIVSSAIISQLKDYVQMQVEGPGSSNIQVVRGRSFEVIGLLAAADRSVVVEPNLALLRWLFKSLSEEPDKSVLVSIDEALSGALRGFEGNLVPEVAQGLRDLLLTNMLTSSPNEKNMRFASIRFANRCLPYNDVFARYLDILIIGNASVESHETVEEAKKGLDPYTHGFYSSSSQRGYTTNGIKQLGNVFPRFVDLVEYIFEKNVVSLKNPSTFASAVSYCRQVLVWESIVEAGIIIDLDVNWSRKLDLLVAEDSKARAAVRARLTTICRDRKHHTTLTRFWSVTARGLEMKEAGSSVACTRVLVELCILGPQSLLEEMSSSFTATKDALMSNDVDRRSLAAQAYGLLASHTNTGTDSLISSLEALLEKFENWKGAIAARLNQVHGALLAVSYFVSYRFYKVPEDVVVEKTIQRMVPTLFDMLYNSTDSLLQEATYLALSQLCLFFVISPTKIASHIPLPSLIDALSKRAKAGNRKAIDALGHLSMTLDEQKDADTLSHLLHQVHSLHEIREAETQFAVGEALSCIACGWESKALVSKLISERPSPVGQKHEKTTATVRDLILIDCGTTKPALKKAAVIWLLCLVQFCGDKQEVQVSLRRFQLVFKRCLSDRDELVQESASRGLGLVYEKGNRELKDDLVRDLIGSFSSTQADLSGSVTEDTELFDEGALPTGDGSITTYKDIMSLASEVGDSSLVYRFMSLASHNAIWSSRAAFGRFGLSGVLSDSSVNGYLAANPKLYPKLYRYRFDPNSNVRQSMNAIWTALVTNPSETIQTHFNEIMEDLLSSILTREWRVRQASCAAMADLIQGRKLKEIQPFADRIWSASFKVLDDIKDSVRTAAAGLARVMTSTLVRSLEANEGQSDAATDMLRNVLPFLVSTSGLESSAQNVQAFALDTLLQIIKKANTRTLRTFVAELVERLLGLLSSLESGIINYLHLNASKYNLTEQQIDDQRLAAIRTSPLMEAIDRCLDLLDENTMQQLSPRLQSAMKNAMGLPSKVGCSRVLVTLSTRQNFVFKPYSAIFLRVIEKQIFDRNETVSSSYATAMGYVARGASDHDILNVATFAKTLYFESDEDRRHIISGEIVHAIAKYSTDRFSALAADFLPFVFLAKHDENTQVKDIFDQTWQDSVGGVRAVSLYLPEIAYLTEVHLKSARWGLKHAAALSIADAIDSISTSQGEISEVDGEKLWPTLKLAMAEKSWDGKEKVLNAMVTLVRTGPKFWTARADVSKDVREIALREARRRNARYRQHAIPALGKIALLQKDEDMFDSVFEIGELAELEVAPTEDQTGGPDGDSLNAVVEAIFDSIRIGEKQRTQVGERITRALDFAERSLTQRGTLVQAATYCSLKRLFDRLAPDPDAVVTAFHDGTESPTSNQMRLASFLIRPQDAMAESLRLQRSEAVVAFAKVLQLRESVSPELIGKLTALESDEISPSVRKNLAEALQLLRAS